MARASRRGKQDPCARSPHRVRDPRRRVGARGPRAGHRALPGTRRRGQNPRRIFFVHPAWRSRPSPPRPRRARDAAGHSLSMKIAEEHIVVLEGLGYTEEESRFLYIVATHSGYFVPRQFVAFHSASPEKGSQPFTEKLKKRGHATWREYQNLGGVYHLSSRTIYRLTDRENLSHRFAHSTEFIRTRLLLLDFILANHTHDSSASPSSPVLTFSYVDAGQRRPGRFANHLNAYAPLFRHLRSFRFLYIAHSPLRFESARGRFSLLVQTPAEEVLREELERYFGLRGAWEGKRFGELSMDDLEWLDQAIQRFTGREIDWLYAAWVHSEAGREPWRRLFSEVYPPRAIEFRTCLLTPAGAKDSKGTQDGTRQPERLF